MRIQYDFEYDAYSGEIANEFCAHNSEYQAETLNIIGQQFKIWSQDKKKTATYIQLLEIAEQLNDNGKWFIKILCEYMNGGDAGMTREEAIADIRDNIKPVVGGKSLDMAIEALEKESCTDAISRDKAIVQLSHLLSDWDDDWNVAIRKCIETIKIVPPAAPHYTDAEVQRMQELEQAEIQKAYELGKAEQPKIGRWVYNKNLSTHYGDVYTCSECGERFLESCYDHIDKLPDFCPKCHTKMEVEK